MPNEAGLLEDPDRAQHHIDRLLGIEVLQGQGQAIGFAVGLIGDVLQLDEEIGEGGLLKPELRQPRLMELALLIPADPEIQKEGQEHHGEDADHGPGAEKAEPAAQPDRDASGRHAALALAGAAPAKLLQ